MCLCVRVRESMCVCVSVREKDIGRVRVCSIEKQQEERGKNITNGS